MNTNDIPYFEDEETKPQPGYPTVERAAINAIVYDPTTDTVLCLDWNKFDWKTFIIGGIEDDEDPITAALREIKEETGYCNLKLVSEFGNMRSGYFAAHKNENRISNATNFLFELENDERDEISEPERVQHTVVWVPREEVATFVNLSSQKYAWEKAEQLLSQPYP